MLYYNFIDYQDFQEKFGIVHHGNGAKNRKNKILLAYIKNKELLHQARITNDYSLLHISSMSELKQVMFDRIIVGGFGKKYQVQLINYSFGSDLYQTDDYHGLCEDSDFKSVRYINKTSGKVYKMKAGKILRALIQETEFGQTLPEQVLGYLSEEFSQDWQTYVMGTLPKNQLVVSDEFQKIYSSDCCKGDFHSCMVDRDLHAFYHNAVDASAAYLTNEDGLIIARCIIYNKCYDEDGKVWRLAERQYSTDCNDILKRALVDALIREGKIDGYKKVGAGCCDSREFVDVNGQSLADKKFYIDCELETYDDLYTTCDLVTVIFNGREMECAENRLEDFNWSERDQIYIHKDEAAHCEVCDGFYPKDDGVFSEITKEYYCCVNCKETAEQEYKEENWYWSEYDHQYFENEDEIKELYRWNKKLKDNEAFTISKKTLDTLVERKEAFVYEGEFYDTINKRTGKPFFYYRKKMAA